MDGSNATFYILFSASLNKYYYGITTEAVESRLQKHNTSAYGTHFTSAANDWNVCLVIPCDSFRIARKIELYVKRMKSRKFIKKIIENSAEREILINKIRSN